MNTNKIIRTICLFTDNPVIKDVDKIKEISGILNEKGFEVQTTRICSSAKSIKNLKSLYGDGVSYLNVGTLNVKDALIQMNDFFQTKNTVFNMDLSESEITGKEVNAFFEIIKNKPEKTFNFSYVFNNAKSTPFFPSASYKDNGFSLGLQPTDLSEGCNNIEEWLNKTKETWIEINDIFKNNSEFLGIDSSIAPLFEGKSSFIDFLRRLKINFSESTTTDLYLKITNFIKKENPKPIGLCGLMFPCLEDFELAKEYEKGNFSIERNIYLSLHSGLGIDTYPIGIDEKSARVLEIRKCIQGLSNKYKKPLSVRFVSDGKARVGEKTEFNNQYLKDVIVRQL